MEKIYMEKSQKINKKKKKKLGSLITTMSLVVIAVVTVIALGFNNSFAIDEISNKLPDKFVTAVPGKEIHTAGAAIDFPVFPYFTTDGQQVFCLERKINFVDGIEFTKGEVIPDNGLLYLMANTYPNAQFDKEFKLKDELQAWLSQVSIWVYLYQKDPSNPKYILTETEMESIRTARGVTIGEDFTTIYTGDPETNGQSNGMVPANAPVLYDKYIKPMVDRAFQNSEVPTHTLTIDFKENITISSDEKHYVSSAVSVIPNLSEDFRGYELTINSAPEGTYVIDANGNKVDDLSNFGPTDKFYFVIPIDKVTETNKTINFSVNGVFKVYTGYYYTGSYDDAGVQKPAQTISSVELTDERVGSGGEIPLNYTPDVPDTGMSTAQTVYFIGLIILLSGVGIIYANVKPKEC